jgi:hypothetical protein
MRKPKKEKKRELLIRYGHVLKQRWIGIGFANYFTQLVWHHASIFTHEIPLMQKVGYR